MEAPDFICSMLHVHVFHSLTDDSSSVERRAIEN